MVCPLKQHELTVRNDGARVYIVTTYAELRYVIPSFGKTWMKIKYIYICDQQCAPYIYLVFLYQLEKIKLPKETT